MTYQDYDHNSHFSDDQTQQNGSTSRQLLSFPDISSALASEVQGSIDMADLAILATTAAAAQDGFEIESPLGELKPLGMLFCLSAPSGTRKSSTLRMAMKPIHDHEERNRSKELEEQGSYDTEKKIFKCREKKLLSQIASAKAHELASLRLELDVLTKQKPKAPKTYRRVMSNSTIEGLLKSYDESHYSPLLEADEGRHAMTLLMNDRSPQLCKLYDGDSVSTVRASVKSLSINAPRLSAIFMLQPEILSDYVAEHGQKSLASGLWARILTIQLDANRNQRLGFIQTHGPEMLSEFHKRIMEILDSVDRVVTGQEPVQVMKLSPQAANQWHHFVAACESRRRFDASFADSTHAYISRAPENMLRLLGLLHLLETGNAGLPISGLTVAKAVWLMNNFIDEHIRLFEYGGLDPDVLDDQKLLAKIKNKVPLESCITKSQIHALAPRCFRGRSTRLTASLDRLVLQGLLKKYLLPTNPSGKLIEHYGPSFFRN